MDAVGATSRWRAGGGWVSTRTARFVVLGLAAALAAAACGGGDDESSTTSFPKVATTAFTGDPDRACKLVSQSEVEAAIGTPVKPGAGAQGIVCRFEVVNKATSYVQIERNESSQAGQIYDIKASSSERVENLPGVGERAFVAGGQAVILRGSNLVTVTVSTGQPPAATNAALKRLAATVARNA